MLETEFLKLKYHANVESNTDEVDAEEYFNNNYKKIDANAKKQNEDLIKIKEDLEQENNELSNNMPWNTTQGKSLHITDSAKYSKNRLCLSGDMKQDKRSGKNKFKIPESATSNGVTLTKNADGTFNLNGTATANVEHTVFVELSEIKNGATYTFHYTKDLPAGVEFRAEMYNGKIWLRAIVPNLSSTKKTSTGIANSTNATRVRFGICIASGTTVNIQNLRVQLEEGTTATEFEQYGTMPSTEFPSMPLTATGVQKIKVAKNITTFPQFESDWENGTIDGATGELADSATRIRMKEYKEAEANKKYLFDTVDNIKVVAIRFYDNNYNFIRMYGSGESGFLNSITTPSTAMYYKAVVKRKDDKTITTSYVKDNELKMYKEEEIILNLGTTELCAIKDTNGNVVAKDRAVFRNGKWQWEKKIGKVILNGTEDYVYQNNARFYLKNAYFTDTNRPSSVMEHIPVSNFFEGKTMGQTWGGIEGISNDNNGSLNIACNSIATTVQEFKTWLSTHNLIVYYILETPQYIDCTAEQSVVLDKLYNNFELSKGTNNIIVESENGVGVNLELEYMQDNILKNNYKANEVNTGKKWIDGKDIYRKIVEVTNLSSGNNRIAHNISNFNELIDIRGTGNWNGNWQTIPRLVTDAVNTFGLGLGDINDTKFLIQVGTNYTNFTKAYIIIEYTKAVEVVE